MTKSKKFLSIALMMCFVLQFLVGCNTGTKEITVSSQDSTQVSSAETTPEAPSLTDAAASQDITVNLHYQRSDGVYDGWNVWVWTTGDGSAVDFTSEDDFGKIAAITVPPEAMEVGFIIRLNEWEMKDVEVDRFIDVSNVLSGTVDIFVTTGVEEFEMKISDDAVLGEKTSDVDPVGNTSEYSTQAFEEKFTYLGDDLGAAWTRDDTKFRVWAPTAQKVQVNLYTEGDASVSDLIETIDMKSDINGTWTAAKTGDANGTYYTYSVTIEGTVNETIDPYARTAGVNGDRGMIIDLESTNPEGWEEDKNPNNGLAITDAVIYELHIRDLSSDISSGIENTGKYLGLTETGTTNSDGDSTGLDHMIDLGITHLHLLPVFDYATVDESKLDSDQFNWGYDPKNYNIPEGSYSTDPYQGEVRVSEFKQMVQTLHESDISVVMDVVYNHVSSAEDFSFNQIVPGYFSRIDDAGTYSNGSGCGNDVASERSMVSKYIVESVVYWATEYHIDGFRFDLVGLTDIDTINQIRTELDKIDPSILMYGEGWTMKTTLTEDDVTLATQINSALTPGMAYFSDNYRDAIKGSVFDAVEKGYVNGSTSEMTEVLSGIAGLPAWSQSPSQTINYSSCHDNLTLFDKISSSNGTDSFEDRVKQNLLAAAMVYTAQGVPFIQAGEEILRTKITEDGTFDSNSYASPDDINSLKWDDLAKSDYENVFNYYKGLIAFRQAHAGLRMGTAEEVNANVTILEDLDANVTAFTIKGDANGEISDGIIVIYNPNKTETTLTLPAGDWKVCVDDSQAGTKVLDTITDGKAVVNPISCMVLVQGSAE